MLRRSRAREVAMQLLFQSDQNPGMGRPAVERFVQERLREAALRNFCLRLFDGAILQRGAIDEAVQTAAENWKIARMAAVDRNVLRLGAYELMFETAETPAAVAIDEAIELARRFGSADSPGFVNAILDRIRKR